MIVLKTGIGNFISSTIIVIFILFLISTNANLYGQINKFGKINFPNSGKAEAQKDFEMGMLLLHSFEYNDARAYFRKAQKKDQQFAMAYWGEAMTHNHPIWFQQDRNKAINALKKIHIDPDKRLDEADLLAEKTLITAANILYGKGTKKERDMKYMAYLAEAYKRFSNNDEIACFYALSLMGSRHNGRHIPTYLKAAEVAGEVLTRNPEHPGALHYTIHAYDDPSNASRGLDAANAYAKVAPGSEHALHMPSHIFIALGYWDRVVASNEEAWEAGEYRFKTNGLAHSRRAYHSLLWLNYGYLQQGRYDKALATVEIIKDDYENHYTGRAKAHFNQMRAAYLVHTNLWNSDIADSKLTAQNIGTENEALNLFINGMLAMKNGQFDQSNTFVQELQKLGKKKSPKLLDANLTKCYAPGTMPKQTRKIRTVHIFEKSLHAMLLFEKGDHEKAETLLKEAVALEDNLSFSFGPPLIVKPSHEIYGEFLIAQKRYKEAVTHFEKVLERAPRRMMALKGLATAAEKADQTAKAKATKALLNEIAAY